MKPKTICSQILCCSLTIFSIYYIPKNSKFLYFNMTMKCNEKSSFQRHQILTPGPFDFFAPFALEVWLIFLLAFILTSLTLWLLARISPYEQWPKTYPTVFNLPNSAWYVFSGFFRGSNYTPKVTTKSKSEKFISKTNMICVTLSLKYSEKRFFQPCQGNVYFKLILLVSFSKLFFPSLKDQRSYF